MMQMCINMIERSTNASCIHRPFPLPAWDMGSEVSIAKARFHFCVTCHFKKTRVFGYFC